MTSGATSPLLAYLKKLERRCELYPEERYPLLSLPAVVRPFEAQEIILRKGENAEHSVFLIHGLISRQKQANGSSQIIALSFPGDGVDLQSLFFGKTDLTLVAHEPTIVAYVPHGALIELCDDHPHLAKMLWHDTIVDSVIFREWAMSIGHRSAHHRLGALLLECEARLAAIGQAHEGSFKLRLTQQELASALGMSLVHLNKSLRRLREENLVSANGREMRICDKAALTKAVAFDPAYLHLATRPSFRKTKDLIREGPKDRKGPT